MVDSNYPDDIRAYDNDPRSPFYIPPILHCEACEEPIADGEEHELRYLQFCGNECALEFFGE